MITPLQAQPQVLDRLADILSGRVPPEQGDRLIHEDVVLHMDRYTFRGLGAWQCWIRFIHSRPGLSDLAISRERGAPIAARTPISPARPATENDTIA